MLIPLDPDSKLGRVHAELTEELLRAMHPHICEHAANADLLAINIHSNAVRYYIWEKSELTPTRRTYRVRPIPPQSVGISRFRDSEIADCVLPVRNIRSDAAGTWGSSGALMFIPWHSAKPYEENIDTAVNALHRTIVYNSGTRILLTTGDRGVPYTTFKEHDVSEVLTIYDPVPNSLEERPTMLDLLQGNLNSINAIYNS